MSLDFTKGGRYFINVDQDTLSVYVSWTISNDAIRTDGEIQYFFYRYPRNPSPATNYSFALDGRRVSKTGFVNLTYLYDGENVVYELWDDKLVRFTHPVSSGSCSGGCSGGCAGSGAGAFTDHPISISIDGVKYYYLYDGLGSVTELIDASENVVNIYRYTPFGEALVRQETVYNPYQFTGRQYDAESGLYHYRARAYSADVGRFMQQDPAGMVDGANVYAYVGNNPVNGVDPTGRKSQFYCNWHCIAHQKMGGSAEETCNHSNFYFNDEFSYEAESHPCTVCVSRLSTTSGLWINLERTTLVVPSDYFGLTRSSNALNRPLVSYLPRRTLPHSPFLLLRAMAAIAQASRAAASIVHRSNPGVPPEAGGSS